MSFKLSGRRPGDDLAPSSIAEHGSHGGLLATVISAVALIFSGFSYYESSMKTADLSVYVPPTIQYARDGRDVFNVPITIANDGARTGTVLTMELDVEKIGGPAAASGMKTRHFYPAFIGEYPQGEEKSASRTFAPLAISGHSTFTETVRFYPMDDEEGVLIDDKGDFRFTLKLVTAKAGAPDLLEKAFRTDPLPLVFDLNLPYLAIQHLAFRNGVQTLFNKNWSAAVSKSTDPAASRAMPSSPSESPPEARDVPPAQPTPPPAAQQPQPEHKAAPPPETGGETEPPKPAPTSPPTKPAPKK